MIFTHKSVLPKETCHHLNLKQNGIYVDGTLGGCGHSRRILEKTAPSGILIGIDQDADAIENARKELMPFHGRVFLFHDNFSSLPDILNKLEIKAVDGILVDLGLSFHQLMESNRGFSFKKDEFLDMRMDTRNNLTAADIIENYSEKELTDIFFRYGEERMSRKISRKIVEQRRVAPIKTTAQLAALIRETMPAKLIHTQKTDPATRVFQALRIAVNKELEQLEIFMNKAPEMLKSSGRLCVISFHSLEDRIVKQAIRSREEGYGCSCPRDFPRCTCGFVPDLKSITRKPVIPGNDEIHENPLSRSAKMRVAEKL
ncbi:16S rRNA (cytosine(1402)-N(4))-methyltransferase RsmH [Desulfamplus magnetovallimortis]|nr:16S rRNA (cytosine(1402)-N(4))-methyltransferase RsmH [Desulfamplus magnetovallimortis]